ncbi:MAG TPA: DNA-formamidopyrimidine glycosylase family protein [Acidimicrobiales bacterium]
MPELPELQAHAERLTEEFGGRELSGFRAIAFTALKTYAPPPDQAFGEPLVGVGRRGKYLLVDFGGATTFVIHLMQGGRLKPDDKQSIKPRGGLARWTFTDGSALLLTEAGTEKRAGVWVRDPTADGGLDGQDPLLGLGPDADTVDAATMAAICAGHSMRIHGLLRDQRALAGVGRRLANEICHRAKLSPFANAAKLDGGQVGALVDAMQSCIAESLAYERGRDDMSSSKERPGAVHHRTGDACPVCGDVVREVDYTRYTVNYCATCQTAGKVLADNSTSKFLK